MFWNSTEYLHWLDTENDANMHLFLYRWDYLYALYNPECSSGGVVYILFVSKFLFPFSDKINES